MIYPLCYLVMIPCLLQLKELRVTVNGLEKERDFYFGKLRDIEVICQENESDDVPVLKNIMDILYATEVGCGICAILSCCFLLNQWYIHQCNSFTFSVQWILFVDQL